MVPTRGGPPRLPWAPHADPYVRGRAPASLPRVPRNAEPCLGPGPARVPGPSIRGPRFASVAVKCGGPAGRSRAAAVLGWPGRAFRLIVPCVHATPTLACVVGRRLRGARDASAGRREQYGGLRAICRAASWLSSPAVHRRVARARSEDSPRRRSTPLALTVGPPRAPAVPASPLTVAPRRRRRGSALPSAAPRPPAPSRPATSLRAPRGHRAGCPRDSANLPCPPNRPSLGGACAAACQRDPAGGRPVRQFGRGPWPRLGPAQSAAHRTRAHPPRDQSAPTGRRRGRPPLLGRWPRDFEGPLAREPGPWAPTWQATRLPRPSIARDARAMGRRPPGARLTTRRAPAWPHLPARGWPPAPQLRRPLRQITARARAAVGAQAPPRGPVAAGRPAASLAPRRRGNAIPSRNPGRSLAASDPHRRHATVSVVFTPGVPPPRRDPTASGACDLARRPCLHRALDGRSRAQGPCSASGAAYGGRATGVLLRRDPARAERPAAPARPPGGRMRRSGDAVPRSDHWGHALGCWTRRRPERPSTFEPALRAPSGPGPGGSLPGRPWPSARAPRRPAWVRSARSATGPPRRAPRRPGPRAGRIPAYAPTGEEPAAPPAAICAVAWRGKLPLRVTPLCPPATHRPGPTPRGLSFTPRCTGVSRSRPTARDPGDRRSAAPPCDPAGRRRDAPPARATRTPATSSIGPSGSARPVADADGSLPLPSVATRGANSAFGAVPPPRDGASTLRSRRRKAPAPASASLARLAARSRATVTFSPRSRLAAAAREPPRSIPAPPEPALASVLRRGGRTHCLGPEDARAVASGSVRTWRPQVQAPRPDAAARWAPFTGAPATPAAWTARRVPAIRRRGPVSTPPASLPTRLPRPPARARDWARSSTGRGCGCHRATRALRRGLPASLFPVARARAPHRAKGSCDALAPSGRASSLRGAKFRCGANPPPLSPGCARRRLARGPPAFRPRRPRVCARVAIRARLLVRGGRPGPAQASAALPRGASLLEIQRARSRWSRAPAPRPPPPTAHTPRHTSIDHHNIIDWDMLLLCAPTPTHPPLPLKPNFFCPHPVFSSVRCVLPACPLARSSHRPAPRPCSCASDALAAGPLHHRGGAGLFRFPARPSRVARLPGQPCAPARLAVRGYPDLGTPLSRIRDPTQPADAAPPRGLRPQRSPLPAASASRGCRVTPPSSSPSRPFPGPSPRIPSCRRLPSNHLCTFKLFRPSVFVSGKGQNRKHRQEQTNGLVVGDTNAAKNNAYQAHSMINRRNLLARRR
ncbi:unnamed protein product [Dicrocoelium dendriticum]|nr:unnamed protein product [Dicrocoelium dendriticum]